MSAATRRSRRRDSSRAAASFGSAVEGVGRHASIVAHENVPEPPVERAGRRAADRHVLRRVPEAAGVLQRRGGHPLSARRPRTPTATASCTSATPKSSAPATCSRPVSYPVIDVDKGGSIQGVIDGLNQDSRSRGRRISRPGRHVDHSRPRAPVRHGRRRVVSQHADDHSRSRERLDQERHDARAGEGVAADDGLRPRFGSTTGPWTTDMFVEAVYKSLQEKK